MHVELPKNELERKVFGIHNENGFQSIALEIFHFQFSQNDVYGAFCKAIKREPHNVKQMSDIPFLPISFFKDQQVRTTRFDAEILFRSSGTTGAERSTHFVKNAEIYRQSFLQGFIRKFGEPRKYCILGLLPSYLEHGQSSLVYMVENLIQLSGHEKSGFYLHDYEKLHHTIAGLEETGQPTLLFGVTYALLDFAIRYPIPLQHTNIIETGGMKGRAKEITREELNVRLKEAFSVNSIYAEYGMTELLSQAYAVDGKFSTPPWMRILIRDETDPLSVSAAQIKPVSGAINVIDLANLYSCSFIATDDAGRLHPDGSFEVLGRMDHADIRGCSLMVV